MQGQGWLAGQPEVNVLPALRLWNIVRAVAGGMIYAAAWIQIYNLVRTYVSDTSAKRRRRAAEDNESSLLEAQPETIA